MSIRIERDITERSIQAERAGCVGIEALNASRAALATCGQVA